MQPLQFAIPLDPLTSLGSVLPYAIFVLVLLNMVTRSFAHRAHVDQAQSGDDDEAVSRYLPHTLTSAALVLVSFGYLVVHPHGGMVMSILVLGMFFADFFEFEARKVEARNGMSVERPKGAITASVIVLLYAGYQSLFFVVAPVWNAII